MPWWYLQDRRELFEAQGQHCKRRPPASEASRKFFPSRLFNWLKMYFRAFPTVKYRKSSIMRPLRPCGPGANCPSCTPSRRICLIPSKELLAILQKSLDRDLFLCIFIREKCSKMISTNMLHKFLKQGKVLQCHSLLSGKSQTR